MSQIALSIVTDTGRYTNLGILGIGENGTVYNMLSNTSNKEVAVKILECSYDEYQYEVQNQNMMYPFSCKIFEHFYDSGYGIIVMQKCDQTLMEYLYIERTSGELLNITSCLVCLLQMLIDRKVIHGDLALFNIGVIEEHGDVLLVLLDFGESLSFCNRSDLEKNLDYLRLYVELGATDDDRSNQNHGVLHPTSVAILYGMYTMALPAPVKKMIWDCNNELYEYTYEYLSSHE